MTLPVTIRGTLYPSQAEAARALGVSKAVINSAKRGGTLDFVGLGPAMGERSGGAKGRKPVTLNGTTFSSMSEAAASIGISVSELSMYYRVARIIQEKA